MKEEQKNGKNSKRSEQTAAKAGTEGSGFPKKMSDGASCLWYCFWRSDPVFWCMVL